MFDQMSDLRTDRCPICGGDNSCAMSRSDSGANSCADCWCTKITFTDAVMARIPVAAQGKACLCRNCAEGCKAPTQETDQRRD